MSPLGPETTKTRLASSSVKSLFLRLLPLLFVAGSPAWAELCRASGAVAAGGVRVPGAGKPPSGEAHGGERERAEELNAPAPERREALSAAPSRVSEAEASAKTSHNLRGKTAASDAIHDTLSASIETLGNRSFPPCAPSHRPLDKEGRLARAPSAFLLSSKREEGSDASAFTRPPQARAARDSGARVSPFSGARQSLSASGESTRDWSFPQALSSDDFLAPLTSLEDFEAGLPRAGSAQETSRLPAHGDRVPSPFPSSPRESAQGSSPLVTLPSSPPSSRAPSAYPLFSPSSFALSLPVGKDNGRLHMLSPFASMFSSPVMGNAGVASPGHEEEADAALASSLDGAPSSAARSRSPFFSSQLQASLASRPPVFSLPEALVRREISSSTGGARAGGDAGLFATGSKAGGREGAEESAPLRHPAGISSLGLDREEAVDALPLSEQMDGDATGRPTLPAVPLWRVSLQAAHRSRPGRRSLEAAFEAVNAKAGEPQILSARRSNRGRGFRASLRFLSRNKASLSLGAALVSLWLWTVARNRGFGDDAQSPEAEGRGSRGSPSRDAREEGPEDTHTARKFRRIFVDKTNPIRFRAKEEGSFGEHQDRETVDDVIRWREYLRPEQ
ncbi:conserved hypothetical protein [Neospora caninum Liverpool]|uniref:Transmembrane protein n=1 Tax=Neospora caninum (strain Liverpool) TaxID=572307 RepID=F0VF15_NEOCL|nr:conserved hypothetical protein [Neospora caninum Liverpool]CBZ52309.1 conserved hypothetical protein [Neospora caninum Liverpool]CEL66278.1 TPA: hypothetical protein BN1204_020960 [Neospora caninum Liverpool]|eukprot:XP_003882341.1 conserved hypothetical protein [Neospora caninum Liverpool]